MTLFTEITANSDIPKMTQKLVFGCVGYAAHFLSSLAPCARTMVARSRQKICVAALPNSQLLSHFRYKDLARFLLKKKRSSLSSERRQKAYTDLNVTLLPLLKLYKAVLSFHPLPEEIDVTFVNQILAEEGRLLLPKVQDSASMQIYRVKNPSRELLRSKWGLLEPEPSQCTLIDIKNIDCILVPGLGFDMNHHRIGYGKGHYDRLLAQCAALSLFPKTIGLGFKEQYCEYGLPHELHDQQVDELKLF